MNERVRRAAIYARVSSPSQAERETILTQLQEVERYLKGNPSFQLVGKYVDDPSRGPIPLADRPEGRRLLDDARRRVFDEVWMFKLDRLGRDDIDPLVVRRELNRLGVKLVALHENIESPLEFAFRVAIAAEERRTLILRTSAGMNRAAREGRYTGGIVPLGYRVEGEKEKAHLVSSDVIIWADWTEAYLVRRIYYWLAVDGWSCRRIADELNRLGVPTAYVRDGRLVRERGGFRKFRTQGKWRPGRIRNLVVNPVYKGELQSGRRSSKEDREVISAQIEPLVSKELWDAGQATLRANLIIPKNGRRIYVLRSLIVCGICGIHYSGSINRGLTWYRCNGQMVERGQEGYCPGKSIKGADIEPFVWADVERFLRDPGDLLDELRAEREMNSAAAVAEAQRTTLEAALHDVAGRRQRMIEAYERGQVITVDELDASLKGIEEERLGLEERLRALEPPTEPEPEPLAEDLLAQIRQRLDAGLDDAQRQKVAQLLVKRITIHTEWVEGRKQARAVVEYRFPAVGATFTGRGSWPTPA